MKKRVVAIVFSIIILCLCLASCNKSDVPNGMKEAQDETNAFYTMYVPENWVVIETASNVTFAQAPPQQNQQKNGKKKIKKRY